MSLTYGEISFDSIRVILERIQHHGGLAPSRGADPEETAVFYDLGHGGGAVCFAAACLYPFTKVAGVEVWCPLGIKLTPSTSLAHRAQSTVFDHLLLRTVVRFTDLGKFVPPIRGRQIRVDSARPIAATACHRRKQALMLGRSIGRNAERRRFFTQRCEGSGGDDGLLAC